MTRILMIAIATLALAGCYVEPAGYSPHYATPTYVTPAPTYVSPPSVGVEIGGGYHHHSDWRR